MTDSLNERGNTNVTQNNERRHHPEDRVEYGFSREIGANLPVALFISPHLDDVAFSCAGTLARFVASGWCTVVVTVFTKSAIRPTGFALACQTDKGLSPEVDYMALRRKEDQEFARRVGASAIWLDLPEAPHRGYDSAASLFFGVQEGDEVWQEISNLFADLLKTWSPRLVFAPQGLGAHVDHLQVIRAIIARRECQGIAWYRDTPYAIREPEASSSALLPAGLGEVAVDIGPCLETKLQAAAAYESQLGFQFGCEPDMREALAAFAANEGRRARLAGAAETFLVDAYTRRVLTGDRLLRNTSVRSR